MRIIHLFVVLISVQLLLSLTAFAQPCTTMSYGWTITFGGESDDAGRSLSVRDNGEIYLGGYFSDRVDFDSSPEKTDWHESNGQSDSFYLFCDLDGNHRWAGTIGGISFDSCEAVTLSGDQIFLGGRFRGPADLNPRRKEDVHAGNPNASNACLTALGLNRKYHWTRTIESQGSSILNALTTDSGGNIISTGKWGTLADFNPGKRKDIRTTSTNFADVFIWKLDPMGKYEWAHTFGGLDRDEGLSIALDVDDNIYIAGVFSGEVDFDPRGKGDIHVGVGFWDAFLTSVSPNGKVRWSWTVTSTGYDEARGVAVAPDGRVFVTGFVNGDADFDARGKGDFHQLQGNSDGFLTVFKPNGYYVGTHFLNGMNSQGSVNPGGGAAIDSERGVIAIGGAFTGTVDLDPGPGTDLKTSKGSWDVFVVLLTLEGEHIESFTFGGADHQDWLNDLRFDQNGNLLLTGWFQSSTVDFNPCGGGDIRRRTGDTWPDAFLSKYLCNGCK